MSKYYEWDKFKSIYLEDSFVIGIEESEKEILFMVEAVLTDKHPMYSPPNQDEQYFYKRGRIVFKSLKSLNWLKKIANRSLMLMIVQTVEILTSLNCHQKDITCLEIGVR